jgi:anti-sigma factor ChrR (cupin superfamily)
MAPLQQKEFSSPGPHPLPDVNRPVPSSPWYAIGPGIWELLLNGEADSDHKSVLQWYQPGAVSVTDQIITHTYVEEVVFLEGGLEDVTLQQAWSKGAYAYRHPGMRHGPYRAPRDKGCLQFVKLVPVE